MPELREIGLDPAVQGVPVKKKLSVVAKVGDPFVISLLQSKRKVVAKKGQLILRYILF